MRTLLLSLLVSNPAAAAGDPMDWYRRALEATDSRKTALKPGSAEEKSAFERFLRFWSPLSAERVRAEAGAVYAEDAWFSDTLVQLQGRGAIQDYLIRAAGHAELCEVDGKDVAAKDGEYYFRWVIRIKARRLAGGRTVESPGMSHVRFDADGRILLQQDFWDSGAYFFEKIPVLGWIVRKIKASL